MRVLLGLTLVLVLGVPAAAGAVEKRFQLVGFTQSPYLGGLGGIFGALEICQQEFPASRMCTYDEVASSIAIPASRPIEAWVNRAPAEPRDCIGWRNDTIAVFGTTIVPTGSLNVLNCTISAKIACCALIPVPEPPTSSLNSAAAATLASLFAGRMLCSG